jgi:hypothetical protein
MLSPEEKRREEREDLQWVMADPRGRRFINRVLAHTGLFSSAVRGQPSVRPEERVLFNAARHDIALWLYGQCTEASYQYFQRMNQESFERAVQEREEKKREAKKKREGGNDENETPA